MIASPYPWMTGTVAPAPRPTTTSAPYPGTAVNNPMVIPLTNSGVTPTPVLRPMSTAPAFQPAPTQPAPGGMSLPVLYADPLRARPTGFTDLRTQTIGAPQLGGSIAAPRLGGSISAPAAGPAIAPQNAQPTLQALQQALSGMVSPEAQRLRTMAMGSLENLSSAPNRAELAAQALQLQREMTAPAWEQDLRRTGAMAAALGRTGSGMTTNELTGLTLARERSLGQYGRDAALQAAGAEMGDRLGIFDRTAGLGSDWAGQDLARAGFRRDIANNRFDVEGAVRGQRVGERDYASDQAWRRTGLAVDQQGRADQNAWRGTDLSLNQQARGDTNAWRGVDVRMQQQGRQDQQGQAAIDNAAREAMLRDQLLDSAFRRQLAAGAAAGQYGYGNDPYGTMMTGAQVTGGGGSAAALQQAAQIAAMQRAMNGGF